MFSESTKNQCSLGLDDNVYPDSKYIEAARFVIIEKPRVAYYTCKTSFIITIICMTSCQAEEAY